MMKNLSDEQVAEAARRIAGLIDWNGKAHTHVEADHNHITRNELTLPLLPTTDPDEVVTAFCVIAQGLYGDGSMRPNYEQ